MQGIASTIERPETIPAVSQFVGGSAVRLSKGP